MDLALLGDNLTRILTKVDGEIGLVIETQEGIIDINGNARLPAASLIKIPIIIEGYRQAQEGIIDLSRPLTIPTHEKVGGIGVLSRLSNGLTLSLKDLMTLMIIVSDNTASNIVINQIGLSAVNKLSRRLNCNNTYLGRRLMDLEARELGKDNYTSARDMVIFLKELKEGRLLNQNSKDNVLRALLNQQFNTKLPALIPREIAGDCVIAHKPAELPGIEHDVGLMELNGRLAYVAVLLANLTDNISGQVGISKVGKAVVDYLSL